MSSENKTESANGTDKPYGQVVYERWQKKAGKNPTKEQLRELRNEVFATKNGVEKIKKHYEALVESSRIGRNGEINALGHLEAWEDAHKRLSELYDNKESITARERELPDKCLDKLRELADTHSAKGSDWIYEKAYNCKECQFEIKGGEKKKIGSFRTLSRRVKKYYPDLHDRTFKQ